MHRWVMLPWYFTITELKALRVRQQRCALRTQVVERLHHGTLLPLDRKDFSRVRRPTGRDVRMSRYDRAARTQATCRA